MLHSHECIDWVYFAYHHHHFSVDSLFSLFLFSYFSPVIDMYMHTHMCNTRALARGRAKFSFNRISDISSLRQTRPRAPSHTYVANQRETKQQQHFPRYFFTAHSFFFASNDRTSFGATCHFTLRRYVTYRMYPLLCQVSPHCLFRPHLCSR